MTTEYTLRLFDTDLLDFTLETRGIEGLVAEINMVNEAERQRFPLDLDITGPGLVKWLERRVIPKNRAFVEEILQSLNLRQNDTKGIIDVCKGLSLNDSYWIVPKGFPGTFAEYNLYENRFSEILSLVAYTGVGHSSAPFTTSPELTTNGMLPKAWRFIDHDGIYLYKGGTTGASNTGNEPYCEYYACQVARAMGLSAVEYDLENWKGILASKCALFTSKDVSFVPIARIMSGGGLPACLDYYAALSPDALEQVKSMLVFDAVVYNEDRHFGNFGVLRDNATGKIIGPAPIFDNGLSLFTMAPSTLWDELEVYAKTRTPLYGALTYEAICETALGKVQQAQLRRLIGFRFTRHPKLNWPEERLQATEHQLQSRVHQLLELARDKQKKQPQKNEMER